MAPPLAISTSLETRLNGRESAVGILRFRAFFSRLACLLSPRLLASPQLDNRAQQMRIICTSCAHLVHILCAYMCALCAHPSVQPSVSVFIGGELPRFRQDMTI
jgi:hypothetical protein